MDTVSVVPEPDGRLRVTAGPVRLGLSHLAAARRHFEPGVFSHRRKDERVLGVGKDTARITYKIGWGPISTTVELLATLDRTREGSSTVWFVCSKGLLPLAGTWRFEQTAAQTPAASASQLTNPVQECDVYLDQSVDARRVPGFVPLRRLIKKAIEIAILEHEIKSVRT